MTKQATGIETMSAHRIYSLDLLRGLVMVVMALDHTRDFIHYDAFVHYPLDLATTSPWLFFTRWVTHFCAPVFVFLAGTSIFLQGMRKTPDEHSAFLVKRGLWLIFIELFVISFAWTFDFTFRVFTLQVIWAIGISMVCMSGLIRLPYLVVVALGFIMVLCHNLLDGLEFTKYGWFWDVLHNGAFAFHSIGGGHSVMIVYPFLPWLGLMMLGYGLGKVYEASFSAMHRHLFLVGTGSGVILFFVLMRYLNIYGDPVAWSPQHNGLFTLLSFLNTQKYPPSLLFTCMTIGPALIFLSFSENIQNGFSRVLSVYGRVPFLYYVVHFFIIHLIAMIFFLRRGHGFFDAPWDGFGMPFRFLLPGEGLSLISVYAVWLLVVVLLYPLCKWFSDYKAKHKDWWLSYL